MHDRLHILSETLDAMYEVISFPEGGEPDWGRMARVFHPNARFTRITPEGIDFFDLASFQLLARELLDRGIYTAFFEKEVARRGDIFGSLAHVLSAYETKVSPQASACLARGVNSIQLLWDGQLWRVLSLLWDEETGDSPLRLPELFAGDTYR